MQKCAKDNGKRTLLQMEAIFMTDTKVTRDLLSHVIKKLEEREFIIVAVVSDMGGSNQGLISVGNVLFPNPSDVKRNVWVFADVPHLIKLLRNNFLDYGIQVHNGTVIRKEHISNIIEDKELKLCPKLSDVHLNVKCSARQKAQAARHAGRPVSPVRSFAFHSNPTRTGSKYQPVVWTLVTESDTRLGHSNPHFGSWEGTQWNLRHLVEHYSSSTTAEARKTAETTRPSCSVTTALQKSSTSNSGKSTLPQRVSVPVRHTARQTEPDFVPSRQSTWPTLVTTLGWVARLGCSRGSSFSLTSACGRRWQRRGMLRAGKGACLALHAHVACKAVTLQAVVGRATGMHFYFAVVKLLLLAHLLKTLQMVTPLKSLGGVSWSNGCAIMLLASPDATGRAVSAAPCILVAFTDTPFMLSSSGTFTTCLLFRHNVAASDDKVVYTTGRVVCNLRPNNSSAGENPDSNGVVRYASYPRFRSCDFIRMFSATATALSAAPLDCGNLGARCDVADPIISGKLLKLL
ncbi:hypothetical protein PR048_018466 [Dryococelus australis]|uniref:Transposable element P transposase n=1 Tax=Dryococelus australis TaxID=614101 RepID=A0ABQ9HD32_9NEOP|nr:hypothetical protein PR048_018466 [Dryococelus australis]